jgi:acetylornithine deacetylase/succinyl-diaminopimelate desuccinylase-like protein
MVKLLSSLSSGEQVLIPTFYDSVRPVSASERASYAALAAMRSSRGGAGVSVEALMARWRHPSLSVHRVNVSSGSGGGNASVIPARVTAAVSLRLVPDQDLRSITEALIKALKETFAAMQSPNSLQVVLRHQADWWLGIESAYASALAKAVEAEWGIPPVSIREGGVSAFSVLCPSSHLIAAATVHSGSGHPRERARRSRRAPADGPGVGLRASRRRAPAPREPAQGQAGHPPLAVQRVAQRCCRGSRGVGHSEASLRRQTLPT